MRLGPSAGGGLIMGPGGHALLPLLVHIQAQLEGDLCLAALARWAGRSPTQLHRAFSAALGETPKRYVARLRLERAAWRMLVHDCTITEIALDCGYAHHETFTRAFVRRFGCTPTRYRATRQRVLREGAARTAGLVVPFELSATRVQRLRGQHLAFIRHVGPYESVPEDIFDRLEAWARRRRLPGPRIWMGIGHDAPGTTPARQLRFDAALVVPAPFEADGPVAWQELAAADHAVTTHVGPFETLPAAYAQILPRALALPGVRLMGVPALEIYHAARIDTRHRLNQTDICLPVERIPR